VAGECSGMDDMFPTIDAYFYDRYPWAGTKLADHGEVWSLPWATTVEGDRLHFVVHGVRFGFDMMHVLDRGLDECYAATGEAQCARGSGQGHAVRKLDTVNY
jgi:hypothetical protein